MVKASGQIEKELGLLQQRTEDMSSSLDTLYDGYLKALGAASAQQLMSAVYHLCTQAYPDKFLALSWKQRNELQTSLQTLAAQIQVQLEEQRSQAKKNSRKPSKSSGLAFLQRLLEARSSGTVIQTHEGSSDDLLDKLSEIAQFESDSQTSDSQTSDSQTSDSAQAATDDDDFQETSEPTLWGEDIPPAEEPMDEVTPLEDSDNSESEVSAVDENDIDDDEGLSETLAADFDFEMDVPAAEQRLTISDEEDLLGALEALARRSPGENNGDDVTESPLAPIHLAKQQMLMEKAIRDVFKTVSEATNELLQKADVMPNFPKALMAAAADTRGIGEPVNAVPNVVKVSVRVMHGEANFESGDDDFGDDVDNNDKDWRGLRRMRPDSRRRPGSRPGSQSGSQRPSRKDSSSNDRNASGNDSSGSRPGNPSNNRPSDRRDKSRSRRINATPPRRFVPRDAIEIEAFPEFAVVNLQLSEVEFADPRVSVWRGRLRKELAHLKQLGVRYKKTQKSLETAQAEDAWRSSWTSLEEP